MPIHDYQTQADDLLKDYEKPYWAPLSQFARLAEEVGELGRILNHKYGDKVKKASEAPDSLEDELGDILMTVIFLANSEHIDLDAAVRRALSKMQGRDKDRFAKKS